LQWERGTAAQRHISQHEGYATSGRRFLNAI
jgi:hypothetical protein